MADCRKFNCTCCSFTAEAWSDGNPYFIDEKGEKQYRFHPDHEGLARCSGNDASFICLECAHEFLMNSLSQVILCPACQSDSTFDSYNLDKEPCPSCKKGLLELDINFDAVS